MIYNLMNGAGVFAGSIIGMLLKKGIPDNISKSIMKAMALVVLYIGISASLEGKNILVIIVSVAVGTLIGELFNFDAMINKLGEILQKILSKDNSNSDFSKAFVTASILFCAGAMGIVGSIQAGLKVSADTLLAKTVIDSITACILTTTLGAGVMLSSVSVVIYQGVFVILAGVLSSFLNSDIIASISAVGGISIIGLSINMIFDSDIKVANMIPGIFIPIILAFFNIT